MSNIIERETKTLKIGNHELVVLTYLTGRELRNIQNVMLNKLDMKQKGGEAEISGFKAEFLSEQEDAQINIVVKSFDGSTEGVLDKVLDLPNEEYGAVAAYIKSVTEKKELASK